MLGVIGLSHKNAELELREKINFSDTVKMDFYVELLQIDINEAVIVSTCNRSEIYFIYENENQIDKIVEIFSNIFKIELSNKLYCYKEIEAIKYLFEVTCGLDSLVIGEDQILGQIATAQQFSLENNMCGKKINHIFDAALHCAKVVKTKYKISENPLSVSYIGIQKINKEFGIKNKKVLVLGSGKMSELTLPYLFEYEASEVYNANRSKEKALLLKNKFELLKVIDFDDVNKLIEDMDIIISATSCPHILIKNTGDIKFKHNVAMLDLALPRDIDPSFSNHSNICLYDIDSLNDIAENNRKLRSEIVNDAKCLIELEVEKCYKWLINCVVDPTIMSLQEKIEQISEQSYHFLVNKINLNDREKFILKKTLKNNLQRLMHEPIRALKSVDSDKQDIYNTVVKDLFKVGD